MAIVLGLDISTSIVGISLVDSSRRPAENGILLLDHCDFKKCEHLFDKADVVEDKLKRLRENFDVTDVVVEEPLMSFSPGMSSATTISTLMKFNGMSSLIARRIFNVPVYISASHARKVCGIKMKRFKDCGKSQKEQTFDHMRAKDLKDVVWPNKKSKKTPEKTVDWAYDETDAYVLAAAYCIENLKSG